MPRQHRFGLGAVLFIGIFLYALVVVFIYFRSEHIVRYEVVEGALASNTIYRAMALREERVAGSPYAGYVNYLAREGSRISVGDLVFTVDETGQFSDYLESQSLLENTLSDKELNDFRGEIIDFVHGYGSTEFTDVYDFKYSLKNTVLKLANSQMLGQMQNITDAGTLQYCYSGMSGIISYWLDGYEDLADEEITREMFDQKDYEKTPLLSNTLRGSGETVYKVSTSEDWSVVFPVEDAYGEELLEEDYIRVRFLKNQYESWGKVSLIRNGDGTFVKLTFSNSMLTYVSERFLDIELVLGEDTGLKIPLSAIAEKEFFLVDERFVRENANGDGYTVLRQAFDDSGERTTRRDAISVYSYDAGAGVYYVNSSLLSAGDILLREDSQETFVVRDRGTLVGVYNINKGYADFKEVTILYQSDEYAIVKSNTQYGLRVYDYIALDAGSVEDDMFING